MDSAFATWIGRRVVLRVALGESRIGVRGTLLKDSADTLRMRLVEGLDIDIYKAMVLAVEEDPVLFLMSRRQCS
jgi:hypothetical protein